MKSAILVMAMIAVVASGAFADVTLPKILGDNMVLQQGAKIVIWGKADASEKVSVTLGKAHAVATADDKGNWKVNFSPMAASNQPIEMTVAGKNTLKVSNILVGEVWVCSGQSNMAFSVSEANDAQNEIASADYPQIRLMQVPNLRTEQPRENIGAAWLLCSPKTVGAFSAVGYFFGRDIHKQLKVPVGLINSSVNGTLIEAWTAPASYLNDPDLSEFGALIEQEDKNLPAAREAYKNKLDQWKTTTQAIAATEPTARLPAVPHEPMSGKEKYGGLYNGMIAGLTQYAIGGVIWYQGESNAGNAAPYRKQLPAMIRGWRQAWGSEFPFVFVQLANFISRKVDPNAKSGWAEVRDAQTQTLSLPKTGMAVIIDKPEGTNIHPRDKQTVGKRLALAALAVAYGRKDIVWQGPMFESMKSDGARLIVKFKNANGGLVNKGESITGFAIAGADGKYFWADATIEGDSTTLTCKDVAKPVAVRFMLVDNPKCSLYNKADLPACPFRAGEESFVPATN